jgi:hypothetical protein
MKRHLVFGAKVVAKGPLVKMHFRIQEAERSPYEPDTQPTSGTDESGCSPGTERETFRERIENIGAAQNERPGT